MWSVIAAIFTAMMGFTAGSAGLQQYAPNSGIPAVNYSTMACYNPRPDVRFTLTWPTNFIRLADNRVALNPGVFNTQSPYFDTDNGCYPMLLNSTDGIQLQSRNYILVRENVRIASCKTDEVAGPYNRDGSTCTDRSTAAAKANRGTCSISGYADLRKVAETTDQNGQKLEIFWTPYSHNAGCAYDPKRPNCGRGNTTVINLREFLYVLKSRDAFDPTNPKDCIALWDAGNRDACSHYFDVYMAEDLYQKIQSPVPTTDPDWGTFDFIRQAIFNCQEQNFSNPIVAVPGLTFPPIFIEKPFVARDFFLETPNKITPRNDAELNNYQYFVLSSKAINPFNTNLLQFAKYSDTINTCAVNITSANADAVAFTADTCYVPIGSIALTKETNDLRTFNVFSKYETPQTFYFSEVGATDDTIYQYTVTRNSPLQNTDRSPALQLRTMEFNTDNLWTWATPRCKPAVYLYPEKETYLNVKVDVRGILTKSDPYYDPNKGWDVKASPNGELNVKDINNEYKKYPYLYYEADVNDATIPDAGWVVERSNIKYQISKIMKEMGFNEKEISDFLEYWLPRLQDKPYYFVTLIPEDKINEQEKLTFSSKVDTLIRIRFVFEGLDGPTSVKPLTNLPKYARNGFVVTDWGGSIVGKSCTDITVQ